MKYGNWVPISKGFLKHLPKDRPYTKLEAVFCLQCDYDQENLVTVNGYSSLWRWGKGKVYRFLEEVGVEIIYPESTQKKQNQNGLINGLITDRKRTESGLKRFINYNSLWAKADRKRTESGLITDRSTEPTKDPNTILNPKIKDYSPKFLEFWEAYPHKKSKGQAWVSWQKLMEKNIIPDNGTIVSAIVDQKSEKEALNRAGSFCPEWPNPSTWLNGRRWEDEVDSQSKQKTVDNHGQRQL